MSPVGIGNVVVVVGPGMVVLATSIIVPEHDVSARTHAEMVRRRTVFFIRELRVVGG